MEKEAGRWGKEVGREGGREEGGRDGKEEGGWKGRGRQAKEGGKWDLPLQLLPSITLSSATIASGTSVT